MNVKLHSSVSPSREQVDEAFTTWFSYCMTNAAATTVEILGHVHLDAPIADCGHCGQTGLRRLVRVRLDGAEKSVGWDCAAKLTGTTTATVKARATAADRARKQAHEDAMVAWRTERMRVFDRALRATGRIAPIATDYAYANNVTEAWETANPQPTP